ncbi:hypothetical protein Cgig2_001593 [Carnegiea gigantea]|uniref:GRIP domain-containing protein n=1 Tax=Carnegiea gigantea TaxID=171969 RepID=A0A9Q1KBE4_9CARY|nr:hypothetical protein Cgig2_001593 [Carnegiea gigantea]
MSAEEGDVGGMAEKEVKDESKVAEQLTEANGDEAHIKENGVCNDDDEIGPDATHDQLIQMITELKFQNEYFKSQIKGLQMPNSQNLEVQREDGMKALQEKIESLNRELKEERQTRFAAEEALTHLRESYSEADARALELSSKLAETQQKMEQEIKERDDKYSELDSKFSRLHKRAKQRIQEVQKVTLRFCFVGRLTRSFACAEVPHRGLATNGPLLLRIEKDDLEVQFHEVNERAEKASSQLSALQQDLERTRQQANEALKAMDAERQQLRTTNNKLRDNIEELRHALEPKEQALETLQQSLLEKEQMLEDLRGLLQAAEEKRQASVSELSAKHQKVIVAEKESKIAEMDAAASGEAARLKAAIESIKGELAHQKQEHFLLLLHPCCLPLTVTVNQEKEKESWEATCQAFKAKLETAESNFIRAEIEAAKTRSQLELQLSTQTQLLNDRDAEVAALKDQISRLEAEFSSYKVRAHSLLQKKDAELAAAKDSEQVIALEEALKEAENEISSVSAERDKAFSELQDALVKHEKELSASAAAYEEQRQVHVNTETIQSTRKKHKFSIHINYSNEAHQTSQSRHALVQRDAALTNADQHIKNLEMRLDSQAMHFQTEKDTWELNLRNVEETWRLKYEALKAENEATRAVDLEKELKELKAKYKKLKEEHDSFRDLADRMLEEKDKEISRLSSENKNLQHSLDLRPKGGTDETNSTAAQKQDASNPSVAEEQILMLARQQARREEELTQAQRHILALQDEIEELEHENRLHSQQVSMLKEELRNMDRARKREGVDMTYLKNVVLKLLETGEVEALLPVIAMLLQFSPDEAHRVGSIFLEGQVEKKKGTELVSIGAFQKDGESKNVSKPTTVTQMHQLVQQMMDQADPFSRDSRLFDSNKEHDWRVGRDFHAEG